MKQMSLIDNVSQMFVKYSNIQTTIYTDDTAAAVIIPGITAYLCIDMGMTFPKITEGFMVLMVLGEIFFPFLCVKTVFTATPDNSGK